jgi:hypothetical protein
VFRKSDGTEVTRTSETQDIIDNSKNAAWYGPVNSDLYISQDITKLSTDHINQFKSSDYNSLRALCMLLDPIGDDGEPKISIDKRDDNSADQDNSRGNDTQTVQSNADAIFKIKVTNSGTEDLTNIVLTDENAENC